MGDIEFELESYQPKQLPTLNDAIVALQSQQKVETSDAILYGVSDLDSEHLGQLEPIWNSLPVIYKRGLLQHLLDASESNFELNYRDLALFALRDEYAEVRAVAIELFWDDETLEVMNELVRLLEWDESAEVRAAAAKSLGAFILQGELGNLPEHSTEHAQSVLINAFNDGDEHESVRRHALEAIANCGHESVPTMIREAYDSAESELVLGAIFAMGRTCDLRWAEIVIRELRSDNPEVVYEAARAAGELELDETIPVLGRLAIHSDREIQEIAIWSLGEIGGRESLRILNALAEDAEESEDDALIESIEDAIGNASIGGDGLFDMDSDEYPV